MQIVKPAEGRLGLEVTDFNAARASPEEARALRNMIYEHKLVVLRKQSLTIPEYVEFARKLGRPQIYFQPNYHHPDYPEVFVSSNVKENGRKIGVAGTGQYWHTDYQFFEEPLSSTLVYPQIIPEGKRETYYIDMVRVYAALPEDLRQLVHDRRAIHEGKWRYKITAEDIDRSLFDVLKAVEALVPPVTHPAVIDHPVTHSKALYVSSGFTTGLQGVPRGETEAVLKRLFDFIEREEFVHTHSWTPGDILYWDNRTLIHRASKTPNGQYSKSYRIGVYDDLPFYVGHAPKQTTTATGVSS